MSSVLGNIHPGFSAFDALRGLFYNHRPGKKLLVDATGRAEPRTGYITLGNVPAPIPPEMIPAVGTNIARQIRAAKCPVDLMVAGPGALVAAIMSALGDAKHRVTLRWIDLRDGSREYALPPAGYARWPILATAIGMGIGLLLPF